MNSKWIPLKESSIVFLGELIVCAASCAVFAIFNAFDYTVILGSLLGAVVITANFAFLSISVNRALDKVLLPENLPKSDGQITPCDAASDGIAEDLHEDYADDEDDAPKQLDFAEKFASENAARVQNAVKISFIIRTFSMLGALVLAFALSSVFNVIATLVPLVMLRPIIMVRGLISRKRKFGK